MQLGKSILGAVIGSVIGIVLLVVVYLTTGHDAAWLSVPFALVTGLGVRTFADTRTHPSYVRGAMTMVIALVAYIGGWMLIGPIVTARAKTAQRAPAENREQQSVQRPETNDGGTESDREANADPALKPAAPTAVISRPQGLPLRGMRYSPIDIICLATAALVAYELGRGSGHSLSLKEVPSANLSGTHPDA